MMRPPRRFRCRIGAARGFPAAAAQPDTPVLPILRTVHVAVGQCDCA